MTSSTKDKELYSGKATGLTFEAFDEKVITWCRKKYGDSYAVALWKNELANITDLDLSNDEDGLAFDLQCAKVYDILCRKSVKNADHVYAKNVFWTKKWQIEFRQSCREEVFCFLEIAKTRGEKDGNNEGLYVPSFRSWPTRIDSGKG